MKKLIIAILTLAFAVLPLAACAADKDELETVRVSEVTHSIFYAPMYAADALGYFEEEGLKIELTNAGGADAVMAAVLSGGRTSGSAGRRRLCMC